MHNPAFALLLLSLTISSVAPAVGQEATEGISEPDAKLLSSTLAPPTPSDQTLDALITSFRPRDLKSYASPFRLFAPKDSDNDGLSDADEQALGSNATNPDTDGDGLLDGWEVHGVNGIDLRQMGASPLHKDIFVQMDMMERSTATHGLGPNVHVIAGIVAAFAEAPVSNPDGKTGIAIHLATGNTVTYIADLSPVVQAVTAIKQKSFDSKRAPIFHYMIWANAYDGGRSSGRSLTVPGSDFIVTLGTWNGEAGGTDEEKIGTFVHELGHNLGLRHGNFDDARYKPNHLSVMNYAFQTIGVAISGVRHFTYQRLSLPALDEASLSEPDGLGNDPQLGGGTTIWFNAGPNTFIEAPTSGAIDWNVDKQIDPSHISADLNGDRKSTALGATVPEWPRLDFAGGAIGKRAPLGKLFSLPFILAPAPPEPELDEDLNQRLRERTVLTPQP